MAVVVGAGLATLHQLETVYGYDDLLDLYEIITVQRYNEWAANQERKQ